MTTEQPASEAACDVSVVVLSFNTRELLAECLKRAIDATESLDAEILVVDNASHDGSADMVSHEFPGLTLIRNSENLGYAAGNNVGIRASSGRHVVLLNSDAYLGRDTVQELLQHMDASPRTGIAAPRTEHEDGSLHLTARRFPSLSGHVRRVTGVGLPGSAEEWDWLTSFDHASSRRVEMVSGACWMLRRSMLEQIGLLNEDLFLYGEEFDLCWRAAAHGWETWFVPTDPIVHLGGRSSGGDSASAEITTFHRFRSDYLTLRWHLGLTRATGIALLHQASYAWGSLRRFVSGARGDLSRAEQAREARLARRAAWEMLRWRSK